MQAFIIRIRNESMNDQMVAMVTGSSTGIGFETTLALARSGFYTYATMHKLEKGNSEAITSMAKNDKLPLQTLELDVNSDESVLNAINMITNERKRIDVVINNAGYALVGPLEETSMDEIKAQIDTNFFGAIRVMQAIIPIMRKQRYGRIVNVTSMGGRIAIPLDSIYHGTKFGLEGVSESLQYELEPFGISIIVVEPGAVQSSLWKNIKIASRSSTNSNSPYQPLASTMSKAYIQMELNAMHPSEVAKVILEAVTSEECNRKRSPYDAGSSKNYV